jgi:hypothetical protein
MDDTEVACLKLLELEKPALKGAETQSAQSSCFPLTQVPRIRLLRTSPSRLSRKLGSSVLRSRGVSPKLTAQDATL